MKLAIDFGDFVGSSYTYQRWAATFTDYPQILSSQSKPTNGFFSRYHGLVILNQNSYANYVTSIQTSVSAGGLSLWFYKLDTTPKVLFSGFIGVAAAGVCESLFSLSISNVIQLSGPSFATTTDTTVIVSNTWHHLFIYWASDPGFASFKAVYTIDGVIPTLLNIVSNGMCTITLGSTTKIVIAGSLDSTGALITSTVFTGYIRSLILLDPSIYPVSLSALQYSLPQLAQQFRASTI